jgi:hypothetical protein
VCQEACRFMPLVMGVLTALVYLATTVSTFTLPLPPAGRTPAPGSSSSDGPKLNGEKRNKFRETRQARCASLSLAPSPPVAHIGSSCNIGQDSGRVLTRTLGEYLTGGDPSIFISQIDHHGPLLIFISATPTSRASTTRTSDQNPLASHVSPYRLTCNHLSRAASARSTSRASARSPWSKFYDFLRFSGFFLIFLIDLAPRRAC